MIKEAEISSPTLLLHASGRLRRDAEFPTPYQCAEVESFSRKKCQVHISKVRVALHSLWNAENIEYTPVYLIIFMKCLKINGIILKTSCSRGSPTEQSVTEVTEKHRFLLNSAIFMEHGVFESSFFVNSFKDPNWTWPYWLKKSIQPSTSISFFFFLTPFRQRALLLRPTIYLLVVEACHQCTGSPFLPWGVCKIVCC